MPPADAAWPLRPFPATASRIKDPAGDALGRRRAGSHRRPFVRSRVHCVHSRARWSGGALPRSAWSSVQVSDGFSGLSGSPRARSLAGALSARLAGSDVGQWRTGQVGSQVGLLCPNGTRACLTDSKVILRRNRVRSIEWERPPCVICLCFVLYLDPSRSTAGRSAKRARRPWSRVCRRLIRFPGLLSPCRRNSLDSPTTT